jgi:hypothetical protein
MVYFRWSVAAVLLHLSYTALAHGHDESDDVMDGMKMDKKPQGDLPEWYTMDSYFGLSDHSGLILAHIVLMVLAWFFILPIGASRSVRLCKL